MIWLTDEFVEETLKTRAEETRRARLISQARAQPEQVATERAWRWSVEPGREVAFNDLLGWLLSSQQNAKAETPSAAHAGPIPGRHEAQTEERPAGHRLPSTCCLCSHLCYDQAA